MPRQFPFTAIIGQEAMQTALLLCAVDPSIGGVLIRGQKGTAKSTTVRSFAEVLPAIEVAATCPYHCDPEQPELLHSDCRKRLENAGELPREVITTPFVDLPLSATEDRLVGTLHLEETLRTGQRQFQPGLLAAAHRGILYVDEVNLLPDHLVDMLLDTAVTGTNLVERDGLRHQHPARFLLVGTMNPEEGELRPQFLDRFGLCITIAGLEDVTMRSEIIRRRLEYDTHPEKFYCSYAEQQDILREQVRQARQSLADIDLPDAIINRASEMANTARAQGHRTELTLIRAARAMAALMERKTVSDKELAEVAGFALAHRIPGQSVLSHEELSSKIASLLDTEGRPGSDVAISDQPAETVLMDNMDFPGSAAAGSMLFTYLKKKLMTASSVPTSRST